MTWTAILFSFVAGAGLLFAVSGFDLKIHHRNKGNAIGRMQDLDELEEQLKKANFIKVVRKRGLEYALKQAQLDVKPAGFTRVVIISFLAAFVFGYVFLGTVPVALTVGVIAVIFYFMWLQERRDQKRTEFDNNIAKLAENLSTGAAIHNTMGKSLALAAELAPQDIKDDVERVYSEYIGGASLRRAFHNMVEKYQSQALDLFVDTLVIWEEKGSVISLKEILDPMRRTIQQMAIQRQRMDAELSGKKKELRFVSLAPIGLDILMRFAMPDFAMYYDSPIGIAAQIVAFIIAVLGYFNGLKILAKHQQTLVIERE